MFLHDGQSIIKVSGWFGVAHTKRLVWFRPVLTSVSAKRQSILRSQNLVERKLLASRQFLISKCRVANFLCFLQCEGVAITNIVFGDGERELRNLQS